MVRDLCSLRFVKITGLCLSLSEYVLGIGDATWENWGYPRWQLVLCLLLAWIVAFFCIIKGIQSAGKVVYFTALFPYVTLTALLIRGATLEGAIDGIIFYIKPDWSRLLSPDVWADAASQTFYSFGIACGSLVTFASYNQVSKSLKRISENHNLIPPPFKPHHAHKNHSEC